VELLPEMKPTANYEVDELADGNFGLAGTSERWADKLLLM
jgi:hypothetical protein